MANDNRDFGGSNGGHLARLAEVSRAEIFLAQISRSRRWRWCPGALPFRSQTSVLDTTAPWRSKVSKQPVDSSGGARGHFLAAVALYQNVPGGRGLSIAANKPSRMVLFSGPIGIRRAGAAIAGACACFGRRSAFTTRCRWELAQRSHSAHYRSEFAFARGRPVPGEPRRRR